MSLDVDALLFDMDGVLVDVSRSYRLAIAETVREFTGTTVSGEQIQDLKNQGGFNDDWHLTAALIEADGVSAPFEDVVDAFQRRYRGAAWDGLIAEEPALLRTDTLRQCSALGPLALVTGRPEAEARWTLRRLRWEIYFPVLVPMEMQKGRGKPDPYPLTKAVELLAVFGTGARARNAAYVGDTVDDMRAAKRAGMTAIGVIPPYLDAPVMEPILADAGADVVLRDVNELPGILGLPAS